MQTIYTIDVHTYAKVHTRSLEILLKTAIVCLGMIFTVLNQLNLLQTGQDVACERKQKFCNRPLSLFFTWFVKFRINPKLE